MAEEEQLELKPQGGKKKLLLLVGVVLVLLIGGGVGGWLMLSGGGEEDKEHAKKEEGGQAQSEEEKAAAQAANMAMYVVLPRPFVFNVAAKPRYRLVQIKVALMVRGPANEALAKLHTPLVEGAMFRVFAASTTQQLESVDGRSKLRSDALAAVRQALHEVTQQDVVEQVLFTGFVMQ
ncbi:MAG: flagellar basal body-associated protein FliL [Aeromonadaceae bacterium]|nr:flagellar basal body-associated protein FliL [Aeromonadaceae bacterium]